MPQNLTLFFAIALFTLLVPRQILAQECACPPASACKPCSGGYTSLTLRYDGTAPALVLIVDGTNTLANLTVHPFQEFKISGSKRNEKFVDKTVPVLVNGLTNTILGSSCLDVQVGLSYGAFTIVAAESMGGSIVCCTTPPADMISPMISDLATPIEVEATNGCGAEVFWTEPITSDDCTIESVRSSHTSGELFPIGTSTVVYSATDKSGNVTTSSFTITVTDHTPPVFTGGPAEDVIVSTSQSCGAIASWVEPQVVNDCNVTITRSHLPNTSFPLGSTRVQYQATDASGNTSVLSFNVVVKDASAPKFTGGPLNDISLAAKNGCSATASWDEPQVVDECNATITRSHAPNSVFAIGSTKVQYTAQDVSGNIAHFSFNVIVTDKEAPQFTSFPPDQTIATSESACSARASWVLPTISDRCSNTTLTSSHQPGTEFPIGETKVKFIAVDDSGNKAEQELTIKVEDKRTLAITNCPGDVQLIAQDRIARVSWVAPVAMISCEPVKLVSTHDPGDRFEPGKTTVEYIASTPSGKTAQCRFNVTVIEAEKPLKVTKLITPDGDGLNDEWVVTNIEDYRENQVWIMDRWGSVIYQASRYDNESVVWSGTNKAGVAVPTGTYFYTITAYNGKQKIQETGSIELVR